MFARLIFNLKRQRKCCYIIATFFVVCFFDVVYWKDTLLRDRGCGHNSMNASEFFNLINATYGSDRILERVKMEDETHLHVVDETAVYHEK
ncbi:hypothetical protein RB195_008543 [Necator americanus]|uniref:Uncharacterized protein n=1 Tax=Necator americanus TaxID=51031 RepID=A0ABR1CPZ4_NECAM